MKSSTHSKARLTLFTLLLLLLPLSLFPGCGKKSTVDTTKLDYSFQTADQTNQAAVNQAIESIDKGDSATALDKLKKVASDPKLSPEQKTSVANVIQQLENK
jgi:hypothetical protein